jgi:hypothetical protein
MDQLPLLKVNKMGKEIFDLKLLVSAQGQPAASKVTTN